jgi:hypothetical protein
MVKASTKSPKFDYLQPSVSPRPYARDDLRQAFQDMQDQLGKTINPKRFKDAVFSIGTHAPKLASSRNETRGLYFANSSGNEPATLAASGNGADASHMKVLLRRIEIEGNGSPISLAASAFTKSPLLPTMLDAFEGVFGSEARAAFEQGVHEKLTSRPQIHVGKENYPVFYVPGDAGGDLQVAPSGSIQAHNNMHTLMSRMLTKAKQDRLDGRPATYGEWSRLAMSGKSQNIIVGGPATRVRFQADVPPVLQDLDARIWRYLQGGEYPRMLDDDAAAVLINYAVMARKLDDKNQYRAPDIVVKQENRIKFLISRAHDHVDEVQAEIARIKPDATVADPPGTLKIIATLPVGRCLKKLKASDSQLPDDFDALTVISKLNTAYVRGIIKKVEGVVE